MSDQLYNDKILSLAEGLDKNSRLEEADAHVVVDSPLCGSRLKVDLGYNPEIDRITAYGQEVRACALGQSAAAIMAKHVVGCSRLEIQQLHQTIREMLKNEGPAPDGKWSELEALMPARAHKSRHASILLPFKAVEMAIDEICNNEAKKVSS
ncbi:MAG: iron-sulfur cluster assembly scaffold protein [Alphaproteobacteria bacterium]|nr:iron-sulfur cluster assembly scaffold protein [Alphaproteobacteria bacterium]